MLSVIASCDKEKDVMREEITALKEEIRLLKKKPAPRKAAHELRERTKLDRLKQLAEIIRPEDTPAPSAEQFEEIARGLRHQLGLFSPAKTKKYVPTTTRTPSSQLISPMEDLRICNGMSWKQRTNLKKSLIDINRDMLAPNKKMFDFMKSLTNAIEVETIHVDGLRDIFYIGNVKELLQLRLSRLVDSGQLLLDHRFSNKIYACFTGKFTIRLFGIIRWFQVTKEAPQQSAVSHSGM